MDKKELESQNFLTSDRIRGNLRILRNAYIRISHVVNDIAPLVLGATAFYQIGGGLYQLATGNLERAMFETGLSAVTFSLCLLMLKNHRHIARIDRYYNGRKTG